MRMFWNVAPGVCWSVIPPRESDAGPTPTTPVEDDDCDAAHDLYAEESETV